MRAADGFANLHVVAMSPYKKLYSAIALVGVLVLGFVATSLISYFVAHESISSRISEEALPLTSDNIYSEIERDLLRSVLISSLMAHDTFLRDWTTGGEQNPERMVRYLKEIQQKYGTTTAFFVSEKTRRYYHSTGVLKRVKADDPQDAWYFRARRMNTDYEINVDKDTADPRRISIFVNYAVTDFSGSLIGVTGIGLSVDSVANLIENYQERYGREIYLVDREGRIKLHGAHFDGAQSLRQQPGMRDIATAILANPSHSASYVNADGRTVYVNSRLIPEFDWYLIVQQPESNAEKRILNTLLLNIGIALVVAALVGMIGWFSVRNYQVSLEQMASTDMLTGGTTRDIFAVVYAQVVKSARRNHSPVSVLAVDIDHFKRINDLYGHAAGDAVLRMVTDTFRLHLRENDTICRWGGDEFVILLADCGLDDAQQVGEKIRSAISGRTLRFGDAEIEITISVGATERRGEEELEALVTRADEAMYASKRQGRDQVNGV